MLSLPLFPASDSIASFELDLDEIRQHRWTLNAAMKQGNALPPDLPGVCGFGPVPQQERAA